jgi:hypothetical protein
MSLFDRAGIDWTLFLTVSLGCLWLALLEKRIGIGDDFSFLDGYCAACHITRCFIY